MFIVTRLSAIPGETPRDVRRAIAGSTRLLYHAESFYGWESLPLLVCRIVRGQTQGSISLLRKEIVPSGVQDTDRMLRQFITSRHPELDRPAGREHLGVVVFTEGILFVDGGTGLPDLPAEQLREWYQDAAARGEIAQMRAAVGVMDSGWCFQVSQTRGKAELRIGGYETGDQWGERGLVIDAVVGLNDYFRRPEGPESAGRGSGVVPPVEPRGIEPRTSAVQRQRSTS